MSTELVMGDINFNNPQTVANVFAVLNKFVQNPQNYKTLRVHDGTSFVVDNGESEFPREPGWYVLLAGKTAVHANKASDLNKRLNSRGDVDYFTDDRRRSDPERNFIKKFCSFGTITNLRVWFITARQLSSSLNVALPLSALDTENIVKVLNIHRGFLHFL